MSHYDPIRRAIEDPSNEPIGFVRHKGAGEIEFAQAGHPSFNEALIREGWAPVYLHPSSEAMTWAADEGPKEEGRE